MVARVSRNIGYNSGSVAYEGNVMIKSHVGYYRYRGGA